MNFNFTGHYVNSEEKDIQKVKSNLENLCKTHTRKINLNSEHISKKYGIIFKKDYKFFRLLLN